MKSKQECPFPKLFPSQLQKDAIFYMQHAYNQAINAWEADEIEIVEDAGHSAFEANISRKLINALRMIK